MESSGLEAGLQGAHCTCLVTNLAFFFYQLEEGWITN